MKARNDEANKVTIKSIAYNVILSVIKIGAGIIGKSNVMIADGIHSASDIISSVGVLVGNCISATPKDKEHNYGHEKAETLVSFLLAMLLIIVSISIGYSSIKSIINLDTVQIPTALPLLIAIISIIIKEYQYKITIKVANKINSPALRADAWHHRSDALSSIAALIGIAGAMFEIKLLDPIASFIVAIFVAKVGIEILIGAVNELMDVSVDIEQENLIKYIVNNTKGVRNIGELRTRKHGSMAYADITICVDGNLTVKDGHDIASSLENRIINDMEFVKGVTVHVEPCNNCLGNTCF